MVYLIITSSTLKDSKREVILNLTIEQVADVIIRWCKDNKNRMLELIEVDHQEDDIEGKAVLQTVTYCYKNSVVITSMKASGDVIAESETELGESAVSHHQNHKQMLLDRKYIVEEVHLFVY